MRLVVGLIALAEVFYLDGGFREHRQLLSQMLSKAVDQQDVVVDTLLLHGKSRIAEGVDQPKCFCLGKHT